MDGKMSDGGRWWCWLKDETNRMDKTARDFRARIEIKANDISIGHPWDPAP